LWLMSAAPAVLAGDLALCHPKLRRDEVRAVARSIAGSDRVRLTVVAADRPGLLADSGACWPITASRSRRRRPRPGRHEAWRCMPSPCPVASPLTSTPGPGWAMTSAAWAQLLGA